MQKQSHATTTTATLTNNSDAITKNNTNVVNMERKRTFTMNWDGLGDDDDDAFFESADRLSSAVPLDLASSSDDDDDEFEDSRLSFASAISSVSTKSAFAFSAPDYSIWMAAPGSIKERRNRLLKGMGLMHDNNKQQEFGNTMISNDTNAKANTKANAKRVVSVKRHGDHQEKKVEKKQEDETSTVTASSPSLSPEIARILLVRSRSEGEIGAFKIDKLRKEELLGKVSKQRLTRTKSEISAPRARIYPYPILNNAENGRAARPQNGAAFSSVLSSDQLGAFFLIKNLDTGKEFIVNEYNEDGMWNRLSDLQTGKQLTMEEFEKSVGYSPVVKELMRRENVTRGHDDGRKLTANSYFTKSLRMSKRGGAALLKNIKGVAHSMSGLIGDKEREISQAAEQKNSKSTNSSSKWVKVRLHGKSHKELSALHLCQEIQAHEGSIWTMKFSLDSRFLASAGEDRVIHVWEVQECEVMGFMQEEGSPMHHLAASGSSTPEREALLGPSGPSDKKKKNKGSKKGNTIPDYAHMPETVFSLSEKPVCSFKGHQDDVLDLCWSKHQLLLSASMDKTVRLWDMETKSCLKMFAHNDYVTCIQFNPVDDNYFISGSLDAKVRLWSIPDRQVVDWADIREMITAACFTPDGQGALVGSNKGICRTYSIEDNKLNEVSHIDVNRKRKSQAKKITGFQFAPGSPSEVLITSADSRIRILDGTDIICKFKGFRNTNSQITASFTQDGKYVVCASEDSQVYVWKHEEPRHSGAGKSKTLISTRYEFFQSKDVSIAIPWNGTVQGEPPTIPVHHSKRQPKRSPPRPHSSNGSPTAEDHIASKRHLPPLPKKNTKASTPPDVSPQITPPEEELRRLASLDSVAGLGDSFDSSLASNRFCDSPSPSVSPSIRSGDSPSNLSFGLSWSTSWSLFDGNNNHGNGVQAAAWGMVIVTGSLEGEIRAYQNLGLPRRIGRQSTLF